jgi:hypothetical protein
MSVGPSRCGELDVVAELFEFDDELFDNAMQLVEIGMINENRPAPGSCDRADDLGFGGTAGRISGMMANHPACGHVVALATRAVSPRQDAARDVNSFCTRLLTWLLQFASTLGGGTRVSVPHVGFDSVSGFVLPGTQSQVRRDRE